MAAVISGVHTGVFCKFWNPDQGDTEKKDIWQIFKHYFSHGNFIGRKYWFAAEKDGRDFFFIFADDSAAGITFVWDKNNPASLSS